MASPTLASMLDVPEEMTFKRFSLEMPVTEKSKKLDIGKFA